MSLQYPLKLPYLPRNIIDNVKAAKQNAADDRRDRLAAVLGRLKAQCPLKAANKFVLPEGASRLQYLVYLDFVGG